MMYGEFHNVIGSRGVMERAEADTEQGAEA